MKEWETRAHYMICTSKEDHYHGPAQGIQFFSNLVQTKQEIPQLLKTQIVYNSKLGVLFYDQNILR